jgi:hypothetical protein
MISVCFASDVHESITKLLSKLYYTDTLEDEKDEGSTIKSTEKTETNKIQQRLK